METAAPNGLQLLSDPTRCALVAVLAAEPLPVCDLVPLLGLSQPAISRHLRLLREAGMVEVLDSPVDRRLRIYRLRREPFIEIEAWLARVRDDWHRQQVRASTSFIASAQDGLRRARPESRRPPIGPADPKPPRSRRRKHGDEGSEQPSRQPPQKLPG